MRLLFLILLLPVVAQAQPTIVNERVVLEKQNQVILEFDFADEIVFETWNKREVYVEVEVSINEGEYDHIFSLKSSTTESAVFVSMDKNMWKKVKDKGNNCYWQTEINYRVFLPGKMEVKANTISGNYQLTYFGNRLVLNTISGEIDLTVPKNESLDFEAKTISGEVFSDIDIEYPKGKEGLRQIVGQDFEGRIGKGGPESSFETISGNIYLRKGT